MITKRYLMSFNFATFHLISKLNLFPFVFDSTRGILSAQRNKLRVWIYKFHVLLSALLLVYKCFRLIQSAVDPAMFEVTSFCIYITIFPLLFLMCVEAIMFVRQDTELMFLVSQNIIGKLTIINNARSIRNPWLKLTTNEIIVISLPLNIWNCYMRMFAMMILSSRSSFSIFVMLPLKSSIICLISTVVELTILIPIFAAGFIGAYQGLNFPCRISEDLLGALESKMGKQSSAQDVEVLCKSICHDLVKVILEIQIQNATFSVMNYVIKITFLFMSIFGMFVGIRYFSTMPILASCSFFCSVYVTLIFVLVYGHMYTAADKIRSLKGLLLEASKNCIDMTGRSYIKKLATGIPVVGIKTCFYDLDKTTTPNYLQYVINQVMSLLLTIKP
ncbi:unnamed protein product [Allacma fusca]|uniref:Uncharacterized protein n=1 Tax=Allacma fusca TaxID=39272 RepID=A0A8J2PQS5_9HEXA|nr:unnamed protein product [Allacma fusca]